MNLLLLPEYLMDKIREWSERKGLLREGELWNIVTIAGISVALGVFLSGAPYVITYFGEVQRYDRLLSAGVFFIPRADPLIQTSYEMMYVLISYIFSSIGVFILVKGSKSISYRNTLILTGIALLAISMLLILGLDYLKMNTSLS
jgi:hypothetical protein